MDALSWVESMIDAVMAKEKDKIKIILKECDAIDYLHSCGLESDYNEWIELVKGFVSESCEFAEVSNAEEAFANERNKLNLNETKANETQTTKQEPQIRVGSKQSLQKQTSSSKDSIGNASASSSQSKAISSSQQQKKKNEKQSGGMSKKESVSTKEEGEDNCNDDDNEEDDGADLSTMVEEILGKRYSRETLEFAVKIQAKPGVGCSDEDIIDWLMDNGDDFEKRVKEMKIKKKTEEENDKAFRARIMNKYDEQEVEEYDEKGKKGLSSVSSVQKRMAVAQISRPLEKPSSESKVRYRDGKVVATKGERYILENVKEEYDSGIKHTGKILLKGKRGKGWIAT